MGNSWLTCLTPHSSELYQAASKHGQSMYFLDRMLLDENLGMPNPLTSKVDEDNFAPFVMEIPTACAFSASECHEAMSRMRVRISENMVYLPLNENALHGINDICEIMQRSTHLKSVPHFLCHFAGSCGHTSAPKEASNQGPSWARIGLPHQPA